MYYHKRYSRDPKWITAKFNSTCNDCAAPISKGANAFYFPATKAIHCAECGEEHSRRFDAEAWDEENNVCF